MQRWEFRLEPLSGWEIRNSIATGTLEVLDARISGYRTVSSGSGADAITVVYSGEPVARIPETFRIAATKDKGLGVALADSDDYADTWGKLAEAFPFEELQTSARSPEVTEKLLSWGVNVVGSTSTEFEGFVKAEIVKWASVIKTANIRAQ